MCKSDPYPEHAKLRKVKDESQAVGSFLDWLLHDRGVMLCELGTTRGTADLFLPVRHSIDEWLAEFYDIDLKKLDQEKRQILEEQRRLTTECHRGD